MAGYQIVGLPTQVAVEARATGRSPGYGHPIHRELATGTGPCRSCLGLFEVGAEERLLLTYRPATGDRTPGAPGPIFIHAEECERYEGTTVPAALTRLPLLVEGRTHDGRILRSEVIRGEDADRVIGECLDIHGVDLVVLRHGEAGCFIARVDRI
jgi:hypothetical protein